ncbi:hypothetical protein SAMN05880501_10749 [Ureibacillus xyleni]|uniref:Uncharacterized protein n=1 Tax=Ureibacillus xyleni TaxID=614648 RepID=A0A285SWQ3_9BACL|nr:hypothetical protein [Ureibacillus xyleni]SOC12772.1 hypothetical protein SAMN05880501_10749 [Ureibacillus xyleni]
MTNFTQTKLIRDMLGSDVPQYFNLDLQMFAVQTTDGSFITANDVDFAQTKLLRDALGSPIPQLWNPIDNKWVVDDGSYGGGTGGPISANSVIETSTKVFVSPAQRSQIDANATEIASHSSRIVALESNPVSSADEKVKMSASGTSGYLVDFVDDSTIKNIGGKLTVKTLDGLLATIIEINSLQGVTGNIQQQLNALTSIGNFSTSVDTHADLLTLTDMSAQDMVIVLADETKDGSSTIYIYNGSTWGFAGEFKGGEVRDFSTNPINLETETTGILPKSRYEKQNAAETPITDSGNLFTATTVEDALAELFTYANSGKQSIASAIGNPLNNSDTFSDMATKLQQLKVTFANNLTNKGVVAYSYNTLQELINKVANIANISVSGSVKSTSKLNVTAPYTHTIQLSSPLKIEEVAASVLQYTGNTTGIVHYTCDYNNADASNFDSDDSIIYDGFMRIRDTWEYALVEVVPDYFESDEIDFSKFIEFGVDATIDVDGSKVTIKGLQDTNGVSIANGDISLMGVEWLDLIAFITQVIGNGKSLIAVSFDSGITFKAWDGTSWVVVNVNDKVDFASKGMPKSITDTLTSAELDIARNDSNFIRFAYYIERPTYLDDAKNDKISLSVSMYGKNESANDVNWTYDEATGEMTFTFNNSGTYTINYVDAAS